MKKLLIILWVLVMVAGILFAEGQQEGKQVVKVMTWENSDPNYSLLGPQPIIEYLEDKLNIDIQFQLVAHAERETVVNIMIAAGGELPDLFPAWTGKGDSSRVLAEKEIIYAWSDLMDVGKMPLAKAKINSPKYVGVKYQLTDDDTGKIYSLHRTNFNPTMIFSDYVRGDWLDKFGLDVPVTVDDFRDVLRTLVYGDPNGNGKADEVGWQNWYEGVNWIKMFSRNFGLPTPDYSLSSIDTLYYATVDKEEVVFAPIHDRFKVMLEYINTLWEEGLINQEQFNMTSPKMTASIKNQTLVSTSQWPQNMVNQTKELQKTDPDAYWKSIKYPIDPNIMTEADRVYAFIGPVHHGWLISRSGKGTEGAIKLVDYIFGADEFPFIREFGIRGVHHEIDSDGNGYYIGEWATHESRFSAMGSHVGMLPCEMWNYDTRAKINTAPEYEEHNAYMKTIEHYVKPTMLWKRTTADRALMKDVMIAVQTYVDESITKFVIGTKPFSEWDAYVAEVRKQAGTEIDLIEARLLEMFESGIKDVY